MEIALIAFSSSTTANRLRKLAVSEGFSNVTLQQTPKSISHNGCTYSVKCSVHHLPALLNLADSYGMQHGNVYKEVSDETGREFYQKL